MRLYLGGRAQGNSRTIGKTGKFKVSGKIHTILAQKSIVRSLRLTGSEPNSMFHNHPERSKGKGEVETHVFLMPVQYSNHDITVASAL